MGSDSSLKQAEGYIILHSQGTWESLLSRVSTETLPFSWEELMMLTEDVDFMPYGEQ